MRHVIVGGSGFLGQYLTKALQARGEAIVIADLRRPPHLSPNSSFVELDISQPSAFAELRLGPPDIVYHLAARLLVPIQPRRARQQHFNVVNRDGIRNLLRYMDRQGCEKVVLFTTDMVYGHTVTNPRTENHPIQPIGPYGASKRAAEELGEHYRRRGMKITIFRPRLIIGRERQGILSHLFFLIRHHLPVPLIGRGTNRFQFVAVEDCVDAALRAWQNSVPSETYNLGSLDPPTVRSLLTQLIQHAGSRSQIVPTPVWLVKPILAGLDRAGRPLMDPEQYEIADEDCILDTTKAQKELDWHPHYNDQEMLLAAFEAYSAVRDRYRPTRRSRARWRSA